MPLLRLGLATPVQAASSEGDSSEGECSSSTFCSSSMLGIRVTGATLSGQRWHASSSMHSIIWTAASKAAMDSRKAKDGRSETRRPTGLRQTGQLSNLVKCDLHIECPQGSVQTSHEKESRQIGHSIAAKQLWMQLCKSLSPTSSIRPVTTSKSNGDCLFALDSCLLGVLATLVSLVSANCNGEKGGFQAISSCRLC